MKTKTENKINDILIIITIIVIIILIYGIMATASAQETAHGYFKCDKSKVDVDDTFTIEFWLNTTNGTDAITVRQLLWSKHAELIPPSNTENVTFLSPWNISNMKDSGDLSNQGNLTYLMLFYMCSESNRITGDHPVFQLTFKAISDGTFNIYIPDTINFGTAKGQPGLEVTYVNTITTSDLSIEIEGEDGGGNGGNGGGFTPPPPNKSPIASFDIPENATVNESITFDGSSSEDPDGDIVEYDWFIDNQHYYNMTFMKSFSIAGNYTIKLTVTDDDGATAEQISTLEILKNLTAPVNDTNTTEPNDNDTWIPNHDNTTDNTTDNDTNKTDTKTSKGFPILEFITLIVAIIGIIGLIYLVWFKL